MRRAARSEDGQALVLVIFLIAVLTLLAPLLIGAVQANSAGSNDALMQSKSHAAAEAGLNDYLAKLLDNNQYYRQYLAPGEATRRAYGVAPQPADVPSSPQPSTVSAPWPSGNGVYWTYPNGRDGWFDVGNGYQYDVEVIPPQQCVPITPGPCNAGTQDPKQSNLTNYVKITAAGKAANAAANAGTVQVIQILLNPASIAEFQMFADAHTGPTLSYGSGATTYGPIYAIGTLNFAGNAYNNLESENKVNLTGTIHAPGHVYDSTLADPYYIRDAPDLASKPDFSNFQVSFVDIKQAASKAKGVYLTSANVSAWKLTFNPDGTITYASCRKQTNPIQSTLPTCDGSVAADAGSIINGTPTTNGTGTFTIPANGAIYFDQSVLINGGTYTCLSGGTGAPEPNSHVSISAASCVKGRVTVASGQDMVIAGNLGYVTPGQDVLGLLAQNNTYIASWQPAGSSMNWSAASLSENGSWGQPSGATNDKFVTMTHNGSLANKLMGNGMTQFTNRYYNFDQNLLTLQPPWFPTLPKPYKIISYQTLPDGT